MILLFAALLPAAILLVYVYQKDKVDKEPPKLVARLFFFGVIAGPLAAIVEMLAFDLFESFVPSGALLLILEYFIGVAAVEEGFKYLFLNTVRKNPEFNYVFDGIVYAVAVSLGFAALENVFYVFDGGLETALVRAIFSVPGHAADGVVMGCFFGLARQREVAGNKSGARTYYWLAFLLPVIEHGFYDAALSAENDLLALVALAVEFSFIVFAMVLVNRISKHDQAIYANQAQPFANQQNAAPNQMNQQPRQQQAGQQPMVQPYAQQQWQQPTVQQPYAQQPYAQQAYTQQAWQQQAMQMPTQRVAQQLTPRQQQYWQQQAMKAQGAGQPDAVHVNQTGAEHQAGADGQLDANINPDQESSSS